MGPPWPLEKDLEYTDRSTRVTELNYARYESCMHHFLCIR